MEKAFSECSEAYKEFISEDHINKNVFRDDALVIETILTFQTSSNFDNHQEFTKFELVSDPQDKNIVITLNERYFPLIKDFCESKGRDCASLTKISSCAAWTAFKERGEIDSLMDYGHDGKWFFGDDHDDLDPWEIYLANRFGFGKRPV
jgi:hypothetical protein